MPIEAGARRAFTVDLAREAPSGPVDADTVVVEVRGGSMRCMEQQSLWLSPPLTAAWQTHCVTLAPDARVETLSFNLYGDGGEFFTGLATAMIDNIVPVASCP